jgi:two-component system OmpR family sensor kinase
VTLRSRLLLALMGLVALALIVADVVTYTELRSFLVNRLDPQLRVASFAMVRSVEEADHLVAPANGRPIIVGPNSVRVPPPPVHGNVPRALRGLRSPGGGIEPDGTFGLLIDSHGARVGKVVMVLVSGKAATPPPRLPTPPPAIGPTGYVEFSATAPGSGGASYQVLERPLEVRGLRVVVGIPLSDVNETLNRLLLVELLVSAAILLALGGVSWWTVRRGLRPLEDMAESAGKISRGELGVRVAPADDRTEVGRLGLALNAMLDEIEDAFTARAASEDRLRRFLADASHELRTPLTSIRGYSELFDLGARANVQDLETSMRHIRQEADRMSVLVDDLLLLARLDRERPLDLRPTDVVPEIVTAVESARLVSPGPRVELHAPESLVIPCDAARVRQVADNLLANALRHSPPDGVVTVTLGTVGDTAELSVLDHGPGVPVEERQRIFAPFHRSDFARARSHGGAGLGLAIVAAITRAHSGSAGVRETPGGGADFWVRLPGAGENGAHPDHAATTSSGSHQVDERNSTAASV